MIGARLKNSSTKSTQSTASNLEWYPKSFLGAWREVQEFVGQLEPDGWRLPSIAELVCQFDYSDRLREQVGWQREKYWTGQAYRGYPNHLIIFERPTCYRYFVCFSTGVVNIEHHNCKCAVRLCREVKP